MTKSKTNVNLKGIVVIVGNYGSGKTEVSVNLAIHGIHNGQKVSVADLDLVNPYFRTRETRKLLSGLGVGMVLPPENMLDADLPILIPEISGLIRNPSPLTILDAGGDPEGATVLSTLKDAFDGQAVQMLQVVNPFRPFTGTIEGCLAVKREIETASRLKMTGLIGNANLINETRAETIEKGYAFMTELSAKSGLELEFVTADVLLLPEIDPEKFGCPVLPVQRHLAPPWEKSGKARL